MDAPNPAAGAKHAAKGLKGAVTGHKPIVYVIMGVSVLAIAYYMRKRVGTPTLPTADASSLPADPNSYDSSFYPDPTQGAGSSGGYSDPGAYGGYPTPDLSTFFDNLNNLLDQATQNAAMAASSPSVNDTGGGAPVTSPEIHYTAPAPAPALPYIAPTPAPVPAFVAPSPSQTGWVQTSPVQVGSALMNQVLSGGVSSSPSPSSTPAPSSPYGSKYPYHSDRGWYRLVLPPNGSRWHYYGPNDNPKIRVS